jgi:hypothetical protein
MPDNVALISFFSAVVVPLAFLIAAWAVVYVLAQQRFRREAQRTELQVKLLERVGSAREFGEFLNSAAGERFLYTLAPVQQRNRAFTSVQVGVFAVVFAFILLAADFWRVLGRGVEVPAMATFRILEIVILAVGLASLASAALSGRVARRLGIGDQEQNVVPPQR